MLTGDENIIDIDVAVFWRINDAQQYLFNTRDPERSVKAVAESSMREVIGRTPIQPALTERRAQIEADVLTADAADPRPLPGRHRDHPGAAAEGRSAGRRDRKLPRRAARQHRRRTHAQRGRSPTATTSCRARVAMPDASSPRPKAPSRRSSPSAQRPGASASCRVLERLSGRPRTSRCAALSSKPCRMFWHMPSVIVLDDKLKGVLPLLPLERGRDARPRPRQPGRPHRREPANDPPWHRRRRDEPGRHRGPRGGDRARRGGGCVAVHRRADRAGAGHPVRPGRCG